MLQTLTGMDGTRQTTPANTPAPRASDVAPDDPLLAPAEAAAMFGMKPDTVRGWIRKGAIPVVRVGPFRRPKIRLSVARRLLR